jgi:ribosomal 50S subunit-recycling heat shock protein
LGAVLAGATAALTAAALAATPPARLVSATAVGDRVTLTFTRTLAPATSGAVAVTVNGTSVRPSRVVTSGRRLTLVLPQAVYSDDNVAVSDRSVRTRDRKRVRGFSGMATNRSTAGCTFDPEGPLDPATALQTRRYSILSVAADFANAPHDQSPLRLSAVDTWARDLSYGRALVDGTERPGVVRLPKNIGEYAFTGSWGARKAFFQDLVLALDGEVDFSRYDLVFVALPSRPPAPAIAVDSAAIAPPGAGVVADGKELRHFGAFRLARPQEVLSTLLQLAGLRRENPDLVGPWRGSLNPNFGTIALLGWDRRKLGWLDPTQVRCLRDEPLDLTLAPVTLAGGVKLIVVPRPAVGNRVLVLENRQRVGLDANQCKSGLLAYEVQPGTTSRLRVLPAETRPLTTDCWSYAYAPYELRPQSSATIAGLTFDVVDVQADGSYRLSMRR